MFGMSLLSVEYDKNNDSCNGQGQQLRSIFQHKFHIGSPFLDNG